MKKSEALTLEYSIRQAYGPESARAVQLSPHDWIVQLMGNTSYHGKYRSCIYVCWTLTDWEFVPTKIKEMIIGIGEHAHGERTAEQGHVTRSEA